MRIGALITGIIGGLWSAMLGLKWQGDADEYAEALALAAKVGADTSEISALVTASWFMVVGLLVAIVGGVMTMRGKGKIGGALMLAIAIIPAFFTLKALAGTFLLIVAGGLALLSKPKALV